MSEEKKDEPKKDETPAASKKKPVAPPLQEKKPATMQVVVKHTGLEESDDSGRFVVVKDRSYINGAVHEKGSIVPWPKGVTKLGPNLAPYEG